MENKDDKNVSNIFKDCLEKPWLREQDLVASPMAEYFEATL